ncbi:MAG: hypothetical protein ACK4MF_05770, partial [Hyphomicrobiaceae bacterium]
MKVSLDVAGVVSVLCAAAMWTSAGIAHAGSFPPIYKAVAKPAAKSPSAPDHAGNTADDMAPAAARDNAETSNAKAEEDVP